MDMTTNAAASMNERASAVHVGLDVHKDAIAVAVAAQPSDGSGLWVEDCGMVPNLPSAMKRHVKRLTERFGESLRFVHEAGPCGYALLRRLRDAGWLCDMVAPSTIPKASGDRVKTDESVRNPV